MDGYWRAPRWLRRTLEDGELTPTEYGIVNYLGQAGADRKEGFSTTYQALGSLFHVSAKTVYRAMSKLKAAKLIDFQLRRGQRHPFRVRLGTRLRTQSAPPMSEVVSEVSSDTPLASSGRKPAPAATRKRNGTSDTEPKLRAGTKTKTEKATTENQRVVAEAVSAYQSAGGSLELGEWRSALARNVAPWHGEEFPPRSSSPPRRSSAASGLFRVI